MLILLPPSEGKTAPSEGEPPDLAELAFPALTKTRSRLLDVLSRLTFPRALKYLDVGPGLADEAARNLTRPTRPPRPPTRSTRACSTSSSGSARCRARAC